MARSSRFSKLMARVRAGDREALEVVLRDYLPQIEIVIQHKLTKWGISGIDKQDVMQSVIRRFMERMESCEFDAPDSFIAYLERSGLNIVLQHAAEQRQRPTITIGQFEEVLGVERPPDREAREMVECIRRCVNDQEWMLLCLRAEGYSWQSISETTGAATDAMRMRFLRLKRRVIRSLKQKGW